MKTAGQLLKEKRLILELDLGQIAERTKIKSEYLESLEESRYDQLPSPTFAKGLLRTYAKFLHLDPDTMVAMFRRDFTESAAGEIIPRGLVEPVKQKTRFVTVNMLLLLIGGVAFGGFLLWQLTTWWSLPRLKLIQPQEGGIYGDKLTVRGVAEPDATVSINEQKIILDQNGAFSLDLVFPAGTHTVLVTSTNRQGKSRAVERSFTVVK